MKNYSMRRQVIAQAIPALRLADDIVFTATAPASAKRLVALPLHTDETTKFGQLLPFPYDL